MKFIFSFLFLFFVSTHVSAFDHTHALFSKVLNKFVVENKQSSLVKYKTLKREMSDLYDYLAEIQAVTKKEFDAFSNKQQLSYLINAYNAFTLKLIINHYPVKSIKDIGGLFSSPWKKMYFKVSGSYIHLDNLEHDLIRKKYDEPRIHFALVCASIGCPSLMKEPFVADKLDKQLEASAIKFLSDQSKNRYLPKEKRLEISSIFKWYGDDFNKKYGSYKNYISSRITSDKEDQKMISSGIVDVKFLDYNWKLNEIQNGAANKD